MKQKNENENEKKFGTEKKNGKRYNPAFRSHFSHLISFFSLFLDDDMGAAVDLAGVAAAEDVAADAGL